ncbi:MAG: calcium-binding protein [Planctomycetota bacterium]
MTIRPSRRQPDQFQYRVLESRKLLASLISWDAGSGTVTINGDSGDNWGQVVQNGNQLDVTADGGASASYGLSQVQSIVFSGGSGDDIFLNNSSIGSTAYGHSGNDQLTGGSASDLLLGGSGNDTISGNEGNDTLRGHDGNDLLYGGEGDDIVEGAYGADQLFGNEGDDNLNGGWDDDTIYGHDGDDFIAGFTGADILYGGNDNDQVYGMAGNDQVYGDAGNDSLRGSNDNDSVYGGTGNDFLMGDQGDDVLDGGDGSDTIYGYTGDDTIEGGAGADSIYGQDGDDTLTGGTGDDTLNGGDGVDHVSGGEGDDWMTGAAGDDILRGEAGVDILRGGIGMDSLFGGTLGDADTLYGGDGADRFLTQTSDVISDMATEDAEIQFIDNTSNWNDVEIDVMDWGLARMQAVTNNTTLLKGSLTTDPLRIFKYSYLNGAAGTNYLSWTTRYEYQGGQWVPFTTYNREIRMLDWDETVAWRNTSWSRVLVHEFGHNWDSELEMATIGNGAESNWIDFTAQSGWTDTNPNSNEYTQSNDGSSWYLSATNFYSNYARTNPREDFAVSWEVFFNPDVSASAKAPIQGKLDAIENFVDLLVTTP